MLQFTILTLGNLWWRVGQNFLSAALCINVRLYVMNTVSVLGIAKSGYHWGRYGEDFFSPSFLQGTREFLSSIKHNLLRPNRTKSGHFWVTQDTRLSLDYRCHISRLFSRRTLYNRWLLDTQDGVGRGAREGQNWRPRCHLRQIMFCWWGTSLLLCSWMGNKARGTISMKNWCATWRWIWYKYRRGWRVLTPCCSLRDQ